MNICVNWNIVHCWQACYCWNHWLCSTFSWRYCLHWASWGWKWDQRWVYLCFVYDYEGIRSLLLSQWRLLLMLSVLLLARFLKWTLFLVIVMSWWLDSFWDSFSCERVSYGEGLVHEAWGCDVCVNMMISCLILMNWRVWWTRLLMISSVRRLSINCDCICLFWWLLCDDCYCWLLCDDCCCWCILIVIVDIY